MNKLKVSKKVKSTFCIQYLDINRFKVGKNDM